ncbi:dicarboxylate/amino acid:cation symporter [Sphingomonas piscis]|uniref:Dicarboxylate/amino acid:cation symporter n=2 Tax=Sphingomonas piscis TaxID=2714943 RepID=A0A6G7YT17_9SPHN|nr:dicarboxylate/amino acid:cation symporter [Sphingomonas piscis]
MAVLDAGDGIREPAVRWLGVIGNLWLNALKMTVIPLMVALLVTGVAKGADMARAGRVAGRTVLWIVIICTASAIIGAVMVKLLTGAFPLPEAAAAGLRAGIAGVAGTAASAPILGAADFLKSVIPDNVIAVAASGEVLPLVVFALLFALALSRIEPDRRALVVNFFDAVADALLVIIAWVLWIAPLGVFALAFTVGASAGGAAFAALGHYVLVLSVIGALVTIMAYPLAVFGGGLNPRAFARCMIGPQSVAISTRSSLASLPAMLTAAQGLNIREGTAGVTLPISVALLRATGPAMNTAVAFYVAHWLGLEPTMTQMVAATAVGAVMSYGAISLPGEVSFISSIGPIAIALGVPIEPLALLVAVEMVPDIFRTLGNVTMDVAVAAVVDRSAED